MSGQDNDGHRHAALIKNLLHLESVHLGHTNVEKDASRLDMTNLAQEGDARWIGSDRIARRLEHEPCRAPDRLFVIDDVDHPSIRHSYSPRPLRRACNETVIRPPRAEDGRTSGR